MANYTASDEKALLRSTEAMQRVLERTIERFEEAWDSFVVGWGARG